MPELGRTSSVGVILALGLGLSTACGGHGDDAPLATTATPIDLSRLAMERGAQPERVADLEARLERALAREDTAAAAELQVALALLHRGARDLPAAERHLSAARGSLTERSPARLRGWADNVAAAIALDRNHPDEAATLALRARGQLEQAGDRAGGVEASTLAIAARGMYQARFEEAFALIDTCFATAGPDDLERLRCVNVRAALAYNLADYEPAVRDYLEVAAVASPLPDRIKATARLNVALCQIHLGLYAPARLAIEEAMAAAKIPGMTEYPEAVPLYYRGYLQSRLGDHAAALDDYLEAQARFRQESNPYFESFLLVDIGDNLLRRGEPHQAIAEYEKSLEIYRAAGNPRGTMLVEEGIGHALLDLGERAPAEARLQRALELADEVGDVHGWARIAAVLGDRVLRQRSPAAAEELLSRAAELAADKGLLEEQFRAALGIARARRDAGRLPAALDAYRGALDLLDRIRDQLSSESQHLTFSESRHVAYRETVELLLDAGRDPRAVAEAFAVTERARARALLEVMQQARLAGAVRSTERHRERLALLARVSRAQSTLLNAKETTRALSDSFRQASDALERFDLEEAAELPAAAHPRALGLDAVRERLGASSTLLAYWIGPGRAYLWRVHEGRAELDDLGDYEALREAIASYVAAISVEPGWNNPADGWRDAARRLAVLLQLDRVPRAAATASLLIVPDGPLHGVPLEPLLLDDGTLLGDHFAPLYLPSASFLELAPAPAPQPEELRVLLIGDPHGGVQGRALRGARTEVERIAALLADRPVEVRLGTAATKSALRGPAASAADVLHIAARTITPREQPGSTGIALAALGADDDGLLRPHEVAALDLRARLAVLSACGTGLGRPVSGEGLHGLARAFLIAGVPAIVSSQWEVSDRATAELMERFYRSLIHGETAPRALAEAARGLRRDSLPLYSHPYYWAPFIFFGLPPDPR